MTDETAGQGRDERGEEHGPDEAANEHATNEDVASDAPTSLEAPADPLRALYEEWFVTYNPLPLASAALVLGGLWLVAREVALRGVVGALAVAGIAELYAFALIAGGWVLRVHGHRRSAVMLGLLTALYQCDLTLHLETSVYLGAVGVIATLGWLALFALKLRLIERALSLSLSREARWVALGGAAFVASVPTLSRTLTVPDRSAAVAIGLYALGALALSSDRSVRAAEGFDVRGRRCVRGVQTLWASAVLAHLAYACVALHVAATPLLAAIVLVGARFAHRERTVWVVSVGTLGAVLLLDRSFAPLVALLASFALALHAVRVRQPSDATPARPPRGPSYRATPLEAPPASDVTELAARPLRFARMAPDARLRLGLGALSLGYLALTGWRHDTLAAPHALVLDAALVLVSLALLAQLRRPSVLAPLGLAAVHLALVEDVLTAPRDALEWGVWAISMGFAMLGASIAMSVRVARRATGARSAG